MSGVGHWKWQRASSVALIPLTAWLLWACVALTGAEYPAAVAFFRSPSNAVMALLTAAVMLFHAQTGIQVVCEDYVQPPGLQATLIWATRLGCAVGLLATVYALAALGPA